MLVVLVVFLVDALLLSTGWGYPTPRDRPSYPTIAIDLPYCMNRVTLLYEQSYPDVGTELPYIRFKVTLLSGSRGTFVKE